MGTHRNHRPEGLSFGLSFRRGPSLNRSAVPYSLSPTPATKSPNTGPCLKRWPEQPPASRTFLCSGCQSMMKWVSGVIEMPLNFESTTRSPTSPGKRRAM